MSNATADPGAVVLRLLDAMSALDFDALDALLSDDCITEYPQSGEIIRGRSKLRKMMEKYPGGLPKGFDEASLRTIGSEEWAITPASTLVRITGTGNLRITGAGNLRAAIVKGRYPDGSMWWIIQFAEVHDGRITKNTVYFAAQFEPPTWRAQWVERRT
jgi:ketosteroid isomerase-like protein